MQNMQLFDDVAPLISRFPPDSGLSMQWYAPPAAILAQMLSQLVAPVGYRAVGSKCEPGFGPRTGSSKSRLPAAPPAESNCTHQPFFEDPAERNHALP